MKKRTEIDADGGIIVSTRMPTDSSARAFADAIVTGRLQRVTLADLDRSGLTTGDGRKLRIYEVSAVTMAKLGGKLCKAYALPYFDPQGKLIDFVRYRYLVAPELLEEWLKDDWPKYHQASSGNHLYYPPLLARGSWAEVVQDPSMLVAFTEGEKKSAKATKSGLPTIGLGGVWSWCDKGRLPVLDLNAIEFRERAVALIFDSDLAYNQNVNMALTAFAGEIIRRGGKPLRITLPNELPKHSNG